MNERAMDFLRAGALDDQPKSALMLLSQWLSRSVAEVVNFMMDYSYEIGTFIGLVLLLCGTAMGIRYIWQRWIRWPARGLYNRLIRNPISWLLKPARRLHRRYSERGQRAQMAKWKKGHLADVFFNALLIELTEHRISAGEFRRLKSGIAKFFDLPDLVSKKTHPDAIKRQNEMTKRRLREEKLAGPTKIVPGGKPGENVIPIYEGLGAKFLKRRSA